MKKYRRYFFFYVSLLVFPITHVSAGIYNEEGNLNEVKILAKVLPACEYDIPSSIVFMDIASSDVKNTSPNSQVGAHQTFEISANCAGTSKVNLEFATNNVVEKCVGTLRDDNDTATDDVLRFCLDSNGKELDFSEESVGLEVEGNEIKQKINVSIQVGVDAQSQNIIGKYHGYLDVVLNPD